MLEAAFTAFHCFQPAGQVVEEMDLGPNGGLVYAMESLSMAIATPYLMGDFAFRMPTGSGTADTGAKVSLDRFLEYVWVRSCREWGGDGWYDCVYQQTSDGWAWARGTGTRCHALASGLLR